MEISKQLGEEKYAVGKFWISNAIQIELLLDQLMETFISGIITPKSYKHNQIQASINLICHIVSLDYFLIPKEMKVLFQQLKALIM